MSSSSIMVFEFSDSEDQSDTSPDDDMLSNFANQAQPSASSPQKRTKSTSIMVPPTHKPTTLQPHFYVELPGRGRIWDRRYLKRQFQNKWPYDYSDVTGDAKMRYSTKFTTQEVLCKPIVLLDAMGIRVLKSEKRKFGSKHRVLLTTDRVKTCGDGNSYMQALGTAQLHLLCLYKHYDISPPNSPPNKNNISQSIFSSKCGLVHDRSQYNAGIRKDMDSRDPVTNFFTSPMPVYTHDLSRSSKSIVSLQPNLGQPNVNPVLGAGLIGASPGLATEKPGSTAASDIHHVGAYLSSRFPHLVNHDLFQLLFDHNCQPMFVVQQIINRLHPVEPVLELMPPELRIQSWQLPGSGIITKRKPGSGVFMKWQPVSGAFMKWRSLVLVGPSTKSQRDCFVADGPCKDSSIRAAIVRVIVELQL